MGQLAIASRNASIDAVNALLNGGTLQYRTGAPADIDGAPSGTLLGTSVINATAFSAASAGASTFNAISTVQAVAAGVAGHYVALDSSGNPRRNGVVGVEMALNSTSFNVGDDIDVTAWSYGQGKGSN